MTTPKVEVFTQWGCPYCVRAKALFDAKKIAYTEYDITVDTAMRREMVRRKPGARTVPQIFIDDVAVGGCDEIHALDARGELDLMLGR